LRAGLGYSDNVGRSGGSSVGSSFYSLGGSLDWSSGQGRTQGSASANLDWIDYHESGFDSQVFGQLNASVRHALLQDRLYWVLENNFGQGSADPFTSVSATNSESINFFSTGPDLTFRFGAATGLTVGARYANAWYQDSISDNDRYSGNVQLFRLLSAQSRVFVSATYEDVQYREDALDADYQRTDVALGYTVAGARTSLDLEAGYTQLDFEDGSSDDGPLFRLTMTRTLSSSFQALLRAGYEYNDSATSQGFGTFLTPDPQGGTTTAANGEVFRDTYGGGELRFDRLRTALRAGVEFHDEDYVRTDSLDRQTLRLFVDASRELSSSLTLEADANWNDSDFADDAQDDFSDFGAGLGLNWRFTRTLATQLRYDYFDRGNAGSGGDTENRIWLRAQWTPGRLAGNTPER
jgi:hypothetical protein